MSRRRGSEATGPVPVTVLIVLNTGVIVECEITSADEKAESLCKRLNTSMSLLRVSGKAELRDDMIVIREVA